MVSRIWLPAFLRTRHNVSVSLISSICIMLLDSRPHCAQTDLARMKLADCPIPYASHSFLA